MDLTTPATKIVFVDIPDTDNILMIYQILRDFPDEHVAVVLSPRPVDLRIPRYGSNFGNIWRQVVHGAEDRPKMIMPLREHADWVKELHADTAAKYFTLDEEGTDSIRADTDLYMELSQYRFAALLQALGIPPGDRYKFYIDEDAQGKVIMGPRHACHVHDFTYGFNEAELEAYKNAEMADDGSWVGLEKYRQRLRAVCTEYIVRMSDEIKIRTGRFRDLMSANDQASVKPLLVIGGPFTDATTYLFVAEVESVVAMAGFIHGQDNLFPNQFNIHVDLWAAKRFFELAVAKGVPVRLLPTECVKGSAFELTDAEAEIVFGLVPEMLRVARQYCKDSGSPRYKLFDWIAALMVKNPHLLKTRRVCHKEKKRDLATGVTIIEFEEDINGHIEMYWNDKEVLEENKPALLQAMIIA